jgi:dTDP-4-amino-4,6-dideoxy-D-galactose acyltransferase
VTGWSTREWDSSFFGVTIGQVTTNSAAADELAETVREADRAAIGCLYFLIDANDQSAIRAAEATGFSLVDIRVTLDRDLPRGLEPALGNPTDLPRQEGPHFVRPARTEDIPRLKELARASHRNTRFHQDQHFDRRRSDELYAIWIERSVAGELADIVWVVDVNGAPCGYLTAKTDTDGGTIGLVAVDAARRGRGYGDALLRAAVTWAAEGGLSSLSVVTQGRSAAAIRFYQRAGFFTRAVELWYHRWPPSDDE